MSIRGSQSRRRSATARSTVWLWLVGFAFVAVIILGFRLATPRAAELDPDLRAVLVDQLSPEYPNADFRSSVAAGVQQFGLELDVFEDSAVDVDLYRSLGEQGYGVLVIRSHSGIMELPGDDEQQVIALFTNEPYSEHTHVSEQLRDRVLIVRPFANDSELTFGITPEFVLRSMEGQLPRSIVIIAGCSVLGRTELAQAFVARGASVVISWDHSVGLDHADEATARCIQHLLGGGMTVERAVVTTIAELGVDPDYGASLRYYPASAGKHTAMELMGGAA